jgi:hypothetical protein
LQNFRFICNALAIVNYFKRKHHLHDGDEVYTEVSAGTPQPIENHSEKGWFFIIIQRMEMHDYEEIRWNTFEISFGEDIEKTARLEKLRSSKPVEISGTEVPYSEDLREYRRNALEYGRSLRGKYTNKDTGEVIANIK